MRILPSFVLSESSLRAPGTPRRSVFVTLGNFKLEFRSKVLDGARIESDSCQYLWMSQKPSDAQIQYDGERAAVLGFSGGVCCSLTQRETRYTLYRPGCVWKGGVIVVVLYVCHDVQIS